MCHPVAERSLVTKGNKTESKGGGIKPENHQARPLAKRQKANG